jgi:uncharacterized protein (TIGR01777 family)
MRVLITGGAGLIGRVLCRVLLAEGHEVIVLSRSPQAKKDSIPQGIHIQGWDGRSDEGWGHLIHRETAVINLAGESISALRRMKARKQDKLESRIITGQAVAQAIERAPEKPRLLIQASDVCYYGDCENDIVVEDSPVGEGWRAEACREAEQVTARLTVRRCILRFGLVLDLQGGVLPLMMRATGSYGKPANSPQWIPWVHHLDAALSIRFLMKHETASGAFNIVAPNPQMNHIFMQTLSETAKTVSLPSSPAPGLVDETIPLILDSQRVIPYRLTQLGYKFRFPTIEDALRQLIG